MVISQWFLFVGIALAPMHHQTLRTFLSRTNLLHKLKYRCTMPRGTDSVLRTMALSRATPKHAKEFQINF
jgi:hypothetical protein